MPALWGQQEQESSKAYAAFTIYRDLGLARSLDAAYRSTRKTAFVGRAPGTWTSWYTEYRWADRAQAWDQHTEAIQLAARERKLAHLAARRAEYEFRHQERLEELIDRMDRVLKRAEKKPVTDQVAVEESIVEGRSVKVATKKKGINFAGYAKLIAELRGTAREAILGPRPQPKEVSESEQAGFAAELEQLLAARKK